VSRPSTPGRPPAGASDGAPSLPREPFALDREEFRRLGYRAVDLAADHLAGLTARPVFEPMTSAEREGLLDLPMPDAGLTPDALLDAVAERVLPHPMGNGHPRFFGWVNSPPAPMGVLAELLAAAANPSCAGGDHAAIYLERAVVRWLMELVGFPAAGSLGLLVSGGSMASLTALAAARHRAAEDDGWDVRADGLWDRPRLVLYVSDQGHGTLRKAAELLGLGSAQVRVVPVDDDFRMDVAVLEEAVVADRAAGRRPFCVAASAGTVNTGAIDPLARIADLCGRERLWLHVDGAYGAVGVLDPERAPLYAGLARADSLALDPHKWLSVPVECGAVLVRDAARLRGAFSHVPPYLRTEEGRGFGGLPWFSEYGFQQTRGFRALKLWLTLAHAGRSGLERLVVRHNRLARRLADRIDAAPDLERLAPVVLSTVCFRYLPARAAGTRRGGQPHDPAADDARLDALNRRLAETVQAEGEAFLTGTVLRGRFVLRACVLHHQTTEEDVDALVETVQRTGRRLAET
jgi:glutamate/tyrosine decarboxylase-like PLP-dependent enzyme